MYNIDRQALDIRTLQENQNFLQAIESGGVQGGPWTNRPSSPVNGQRYNSSDGAPGGGPMDFYWNSTLNLWLSVEPKILKFGTRGTQAYPQGTTLFDDNVGGATQLNGFLLERLDLSFFPTSAQSVSNYYAVSIVGTRLGGTQATTLSGTTDTKLLTQNGWNPMPITATANNVFSNLYHNLELTMTVNGTPGPFYFDGTAQIRWAK